MSVGKTPGPLEHYLEYPTKNHYLQEEEEEEDDEEEEEQMGIAQRYL